jgi:hypothetical protein
MENLALCVRMLAVVVVTRVPKSNTKCEATVSSDLSLTPVGQGLGDASPKSSRNAKSIG